MSKHEELVDQLGEIDATIEQMRIAMADKEAERVEVIQRLAQRPAAEAPVAPQEPVQLLGNPPATHDWFAPPGDAQRPDETRAMLLPLQYSAVMVHRDRVPRGVGTYIRMADGRFEVHLLHVIADPKLVAMPQEMPALCGVTSTNQPSGNRAWEPVEFDHGRSHAEVCRACFLQVDQASRPL